MAFKPLSYDSSIPAFVPADDLPAYLITGVPVNQTLYVQYGSSVPSPTGSVIAPYPSIQAAMTYITAQPPGLTWTIYVSPGTEPGGGIIVPPNVTISIIGDSPQSTFTGPYIITAQAPTPTVVQYRGVTAGNVVVSDGASPGAAVIIMDDVHVTSIAPALGSTSEMVVDLGARSLGPSYGAPTYRPMAVGDITALGPVTANYTQFNSTVEAESLNASNSSFDGDITLTTADSSSITTSTFPTSGITITYTVLPGVITLDPPSSLSFDIAAGIVSNGSYVRSNGIQVAYQSYAGAAPQLGEIFYYSTASGEITGARADSSSTSQVAGVYNNQANALMTTPGTKTYVYFEPGLDLNSGDIFYLSPFTARAATNEEPLYPNLSVRLGVVYDSTGYDNLLGGAVLCMWLPNPSIQRETYLVTLASLAPGGVWYPNEYVGPTCGTSSNASLIAFGTGVGFYLVPQSGYLQGFHFMNATPSGTDFSADLYIAPGGNPGLFSYSGSTAYIQTGAYTYFTSTDLIPVLGGDILVFYNPNGFGYTSGALTITSKFIAANILAP